jgi:hypothetical protein
MYAPSSCSPLCHISWCNTKNATTLASACEDAKGLTWKVDLLEDDLVAEHRAREASEREHQAHFEELTLI